MAPGAGFGRVYFNAEMIEITTIACVIYELMHSYFLSPCVLLFLKDRTQSS